MARKIVLIVTLALLVRPAPRAAADEGMWLLNQPPTAALKDRYGFEPDAAWLEHLQKSCVKMGASGSLVSANGLLMTNHHVGSDALEKLSTPQRDLYRDGYVARSAAEELRCPEMEVELLWSIEDVTQRVTSAAKPDAAPAAAYEARRKRMTEIEQEEGGKSGLRCEVVTLYHGARYHLYSYKRYDDVRLVMAPEKAIAFFGGDTDNFEYPRFDLDVCFFRVYEGGKPLRPEHYLRWGGGAVEGELALVCGHPARTRRLYTTDHLRFLRDVELPASLDFIRRREVALTVFGNRSEEHWRISNGDLFGYQNGRKARMGVLAALQDPRVMESRGRAEDELRGAIARRPELQAQWGDAWRRIAQAQEKYREFFARHEALRAHGRALRSDLYRIAHTLVELAGELPKPAIDRLREYRDSELPSVYQELYSPAPIYESLEIDRVADGLSYLAERFGGEDRMVRAALGGLPPRARAEELVRGCTLRDVGVRKALAAKGKAGLTGSEDPMIKLALELNPETQHLRKRFEDEVESVERDGYAKLAAAMFAMRGADSYPDATGTLRLAFGRVAGYEEDGRQVPASTTLAGLYERWQQRRGVFPFELPQRWLERKDRLRLDTPFNFVCTADIIGGNSGSPVVNTRGEVIGLIFDGNLQSLCWDVYYDDRQARAVAVDSRAIIEALRAVYDAGALADELLGE